MSATVHVLCAVFNGATFLPEFLRSMQAQTHHDWVLWLRDDGSTDDSIAIVCATAEQDLRVRLLPSDDVRRGAVGAFRALWAHAPSDAEYLMFADQDDVWLSHKIERSLSVMQSAEGSQAGPILLHTDLRVVDATLQEVAPSFWRYAHLMPQPVALSRYIVHNVVTGCTVLVNRALRECVGLIPPEAAMHDWWVACVAAAFGRVIAVPDPSVLYRQHGANTIGARESASTLSWSAVPRRAVRALGQMQAVRRDIAIAARQACAFANAYQAELPASDRAFLHAYSRMPAQRLLQRKVAVLRMQLLPEHGFLRNVGLWLRA